MVYFFVMKRLFSIVCATLVAGFIWAQEPVRERPQRTPEEEAMKQTMRLQRELGIRDSVRIDTLYRMHLKYARIRQKGLTRAQEMDRMNAIYAELKNLLTPSEFEQFMNHPAEQPRRPRGAHMLAPNNSQAPTTSPQTNPQ